MPSRAAAGTSITRVRIWTRSATVWPPAALTAASISAAVAAALNLTRMGSVGPLLGAGPVVVAVADGEAVAVAVGLAVAGTAVGVAVEVGAVVAVLVAVEAAVVS